MSDFPNWQQMPPVTTPPSSASENVFEEWIGKPTTLPAAPVDNVFGRRLARVDYRGQIVQEAGDES